MSEAEQLTANTTFLKRAIDRGDEIILSNPIDLKKLETAGSFGKEIQYLRDAGYYLNEYGTRMIKGPK